MPDDGDLRGPPRAPPPAEIACRACGACCCNSARNRSTGFRDYIEVKTTDRLYREGRALLRQLGERNRAGVFHLRLVGEEQRCVALAGELGAAVSCSIYALRPSGCRRVEAGDDECRRARRLHGLPPLALS